MSAKPAKPPKPYENFPLFAHAKGYWCKTINRRHESFGSWAWPDEGAYEASWRAALKRYHQYQEDLAHGRLIAERPELLTVEALVDAYLGYQHARTTGKGQEILPASFSELRRIVTGFRDFVGAQSTIGELEAFDPLHPDASPIQRYVSAMGESYGWHQFNKRMTIVGGMWNWAEHPIKGVLGKPFRLKALFAKREELLKRREKRKRAEERGKQRFTPDEMNAFFAHAPQPLRAMLKLMYFAAFGNSDCADVPATAINLEPNREAGLPGGWAIAYFVRPKTEIERAAVLPKTAVDDLKEAMGNRPKAADKAWDNRIFLTRFGVPWVRDRIHYEPRDDAPDAPEVIHHTTNIDSLAQEFRKLRNRLSHCPEHGWFAAGEFAGPGRRSDRREQPPAAKRPAALLRCPWGASVNLNDPQRQMSGGCGKPLTPMRKLGAYTFRHTAITYASGCADVDTLHLFEGHAIPGVRKEYIEEVETHKLKLIAERLLVKLTQEK